MLEVRGGQTKAIIPSLNLQFLISSHSKTLFGLSSGTAKVTRVLNPGMGQQQ